MASNFEEKKIKKYYVEMNTNQLKKEFEKQESLYYSDDLIPTIKTSSCRPPSPNPPHHHHQKITTPEGNVLEWSFALLCQLQFI